MTTGSTSASVVNEALVLIAARATVTGTNPTFDGSAAGNAAGLIYTPLVNLLLRKQDWEFARRTGFAPAGVGGYGSDPALPYEWIYPTDCLRIRQVYPTSYNANDPQAVRWNVADDIIGGTPTKVLFTSIPSVLLAYTTSNVGENQWDAGFQETFVRLLGSGLAMGLGGRPDFSEKFLEQANALATQMFGLDS